MNNTMMSEEFTRRLWQEVKEKYQATPRAGWFCWDNRAQVGRETHRVQNGKCSICGASEEQCARDARALQAMQEYMQRLRAAWEEALNQRKGGK